MFVRQALVKISAGLSTVALCLSPIWTPLCFQGGDLASANPRPFGDVSSYSLSVAADASKQCFLINSNGQSRRCAQRNS